MDCEEVNGSPPTPYHDAAHSCGNGHLGCCTPKHLRWATRSENIADAITHGTMGRGAYGHKLDQIKVLAIRTKLAAGVSQRKIATEFGISQGMVTKINTGKNW